MNQRTVFDSIEFLRELAEDFDSSELDELNGDSEHLLEIAYRLAQVASIGDLIVQYIPAELVQARFEALAAGVEAALEDAEDVA